MHPLKILLICLLAMSVFSAEPTPKIRRGSFLGTWESARNDGLWCRIEFEKDKGKLFTFRGDKHLSTLSFHWSLNSSRDRISLGVNGHANAIGDGQLQLALKPANTNVVTVREALLKQIRAADQIL